MKTITKNRNDIDRAVNVICDEIDNLMMNGQGVIMCSSGNEIISLSNKLRALHFIEYPVGTLERSLKKTLLDACFAAEISGPGATESFLRLASLCLKRSRQDYSTFLAIFKEDVTKFDEFVRSNTIDIKEDELWSMLKSFTTDSVEFDIVKCAIESVGLEGKIFINESSSDVSIVEVFDGYNFCLDVITKPYAIDTWYGCNVRCLIVDGIIESVAEIHSLLDSANTSKECLMIAARGFEEEVVKTIKLNNDRGTLNVVLVRVPYDINSVNILNDVAVVCGTDVLSSEKGQLLNSVKISDLERCDRVTVSQQNMNVLNSVVSQSVSLHANAIARMRDSTNDSYVRNIYDIRLRSLVSKSAKISVPKKSANKGLSIERLDFVLRSLKSLMRFGYCERPSKDSISYIDNCIFADKNALPIGAIKSSVEHVSKFIDLLARTGCCVLSVTSQ